MSGYRIAGSRAIRIDMLERLADMLRAEDSRGGFEAKADMLSITGMTLEQFADLMKGLGYNAEMGEREKVKATDAVVTTDAGQTVADVPVMDAAQDVVPTAAAGTEDTPAADDVPAEVAAIDDEGIAPIAEEAAETPEVSDHIPEVSETEVPVGKAADAEVAGPETETFYTFTWARPARSGGNARQGGGRPAGKGQGQGQGQGQGRPRGKQGGGPRKGGKPQGAQNFSARPPKKEKAIDPDNPFAAALMGLKDNK